MFRTTSRTLLRAGFVLAVFCSWPPGASIGQTVQTVCTAPQCFAAASVSPTSVAAGTTAAQLNLVTNGTIDLGNVTSCEKNCGAQQFGIKPNVGISNYKIIDQTAQELVFTMDIPSSAQPGIWTLFVNDASGHEVVALNLKITQSVSGGGLCEVPQNCRTQCCGKPGAQLCCSENTRCILEKCVNTTEQPR
jgi:hypothetical protein